MEEGRAEDGTFLPGNKLSVGNKGGRERTVSLSEEEMIALGEEMLEWISKNPDIIHMRQWYSIIKGILHKEWQTYIRRPEFIPYYEKAMSFIALKYLDKNSIVRDKVVDRWQRVYFPDLRDSEDKDKDDDMQRDKQVAKETQSWATIIEKLESGQIKQV